MTQMMTMENNINDLNSKDDDDDNNSDNDDDDDDTKDSNLTWKQVRAAKE